MGMGSVPEDTALLLYPLESMLRFRDPLRTHLLREGLLPGRQADSGQQLQWMLTNAGGGGWGRAGLEEQGRGLMTKRKKSRWGAGEPAMAKEAPDDQKHARGTGEEDGKEKRGRRKGCTS